MNTNSDDFFSEQRKKTERPRVAEDTLRKILESFGYNSKKKEEVEERYELEKVYVLTYENLIEWIQKNLPNDAEAALVVRGKNPNESSDFKLQVRIVFLSGKTILLSSKHVKKIIYCTVLNADMKKLFGDDDSIVIK